MTETGLISKWVIDFGLGVGCLLMAVLWLNRDRSAVMAEAGRAREAWNKQVVAEIEECRRSREQLRREVAELQTEVRNLLRAMLAQAPSCGLGCVKDPGAFAKHLTGPEKKP